MIRRLWCLFRGHDWVTEIDFPGIYTRYTDECQRCPKKRQRIILEH